MRTATSTHINFTAFDRYNLGHTLKKATSTLEYLIDSGIDLNKLRYKGYGERVQLVKCGDDCNEKERFINRRCELLILK